MIPPHDPRPLLEAMEQNAKMVSGPSKGLLQSEDLYQVQYDSLVCLCVCSSFLFFFDIYIFFFFSFLNS